MRTLAADVLTRLSPTEEALFQMNEDNYEEHGCGGLLKPARVHVERRGMLWTVPGLRCDECGEELLEP